MSISFDVPLCTRMLLGGLIQPTTPVVWVTSRLCNLVSLAYPKEVFSSPRKHLNLLRLHQQNTFSCLWKRRPLRAFTHKNSTRLTYLLENRDARHILPKRPNRIAARQTITTFVTPKDQAVYIPEGPEGGESTIQKLLCPQPNSQHRHPITHLQVSRPLTPRILRPIPPTLHTKKTLGPTIKPSKTPTSSASPMHMTSPI